MKPSRRHLILVGLLCAVPTALFAQPGKVEPTLKVFDVWAKTTVPGGSVSAAYMHIKSGKPLRLVKAESTLTPNVEIHSMAMKEGVMEMRAVDAVEIPPNKLVDLKPGGFHIMLIKVNKPINKGDSVPLKLTFANADKTTFSVDVVAKGLEKDSGGHKH